MNIGVAAPLEHVLENGVSDPVWPCNRRGFKNFITGIMPYSYSYLDNFGTYSRGQMSGITQKKTEITLLLECIHNYSLNMYT